MDTAADLDPGPEGGSNGSPTPVRQMSLWQPPRSTRNTLRRRRRITVVSGVVAAVLVLAGGIATAWALTGGDESDAAEEAAHLERFVGSWAGEMTQVDTEGEHVADWHAEVRVEEGAERGGTAWTTFNCSGTLELSARDGDRVVYAYTELADPEDRCVDEAELTLWPDDDGLMAEWSSVTDEGTRMTSTGAMD
ncbi:hypothetical protein KIK06_17730 [Nocardiopsis sp. EMB25]|uniref:hypothetical protein n=1 Tax=Nocardiopsis TaxID=2013 RepID=UPI0003496F62|nr:MULTISPECIES: hypothetical protein [Nocardiopsis]MCY9785730.1 hypothetical protein [Nocardiopsis sp. EMB25]